MRVNATLTRKLANAKRNTPFDSECGAVRPAGALAQQPAIAIAAATPPTH